jgi:hypothetical protein
MCHQKSHRRKPTVEVRPTVGFRRCRYVQQNYNFILDCYNKEERPINELIEQYMNSVHTHTHTHVIYKLQDTYKEKHVILLEAISKRKRLL